MPKRKLVFHKEFDEVLEASYICDSCSQDSAAHFGASVKYDPHGRQLNNVLNLQPKDDQRKDGCKNGWNSKQLQCKVESSLTPLEDSVWRDEIVEIPSQSDSFLCEESEPCIISQASSSASDEMGIISNKDNQSILLEVTSGASDDADGISMSNSCLTSEDHLHLVPETPEKSRLMNRPQSSAIEISWSSPVCGTQSQLDVSSSVFDDESISTQSDSQRTPIEKRTGSEWLHSISSLLQTPDKPVETNDWKTPAESSHKRKRVKGGFAEQLLKLLSRDKVDTEFWKRNYRPGRSQSCLLRLTKLIGCNGGVFLAGCEQVENPSSSPEIQLEYQEGQSLCVLLHQNLVQKLSICVGLVLRVIPPWPMVHLDALNETIIICPIVVSVQKYEAACDSPRRSPVF